VWRFDWYWLFALGDDFMTLMAARRAFSCMLDELRGVRAAE
jgi:hypothetical protein